jgi:glycosyltransferase involved in cell wall biosynthesis
MDDGSTDNTKSMVEDWIREGDFDIRYYYQENSGKGVSINRGVEKARGELFFIVDSDDWLSDDALESICHAWQSVTEQEKPFFAGICGLCAYKDGKIVGTKFPFDSMTSDPIEIRTFYDVRGDKSEVFRTDVLKQFPFPENTGKFVPEGLIWNRIAQKYKMRYVNNIWKYTEYQADGLSAKSIEIRVKNLDVTLLYYRELCEIKNKQVKFKYKLRAVINYCRFSLHKRELLKSLNNLKGFRNKPFLIASIPIGFFLYCKDKLRIRGKLL